MKEQDKAAGSDPIQKAGKRRYLTIQPFGYRVRTIIYLYVKQ